jgi:hypothetical protein
LTDPAESVVKAENTSTKPILSRPSSALVCAVLLSQAMFHNIRWAYFICSSKAKMSALSKVEMSVSPPFCEFGGCHFDGHNGDEQTPAEPAAQAVVRLQLDGFKASAGRVATLFFRVHF